MKKLYSCLLILPLFICCTIENEPFKPVTENQSGYLQRAGKELPVNSNNSFDIAGELYHEILEGYYARNLNAGSATAILHVLDSIALTNPKFQMVKGNPYVSPNPTSVEFIVSNPIITVPETISKTGMSTVANLSFFTFLQDLKSRCKDTDDYDLIYEFIVSYENEVVSNASYTSFDQHIILSSTSIARFSTYRNKKKLKKNTDRDWDLLIAGIVAGTDGLVQYGTGNAIIMSATVTVVSD